MSCNSSRKVSASSTRSRGQSPNPPTENPATGIAFGIASNTNSFTAVGNEWPVWDSRSVSPTGKNIPNNIVNATGTVIPTSEAVIHVTDDGWTTAANIVPFQSHIDSVQRPGLQSGPPQRAENIPQSNTMPTGSGGPMLLNERPSVALANQWFSQPAKNEPRPRYSDITFPLPSSPPRVSTFRAPQLAQLPVQPRHGHFEPHPLSSLTNDDIPWGHFRGMPVEEEQASYQIGPPMPSNPHPGMLPPLLPQLHGPYNTFPPDYPGYFLMTPPEPFTDYSFGFDTYRNMPGPPQFLPSHAGASNNNIIYPNHSAPVHSTSIPDLRHQHLHSISYDFPPPAPVPTFFYPSPPHILLSHQIPTHPRISLGPGTVNQLANNFDRQRRELSQNTRVVPPSLSPRRLPFNRSPHTKQVNHPPPNCAQLSLQGGNRAARRGNNLLNSPAAVRSALLEDFRANRDKQWALKDLFGHIVEFSGDQHGSRFIQQQLEEASDEERQLVFEEIVPKKTDQLIQDVFGNYVIQKFLELGTPAQRDALANAVEDKVVSFSLQIYGCRVVQKAIECISEAQQTAIILCLEQHILTCIKDAHGNHVVQKLVEVVSPERLTFLRLISDNIRDLATHPYGCRVLQRCLEHLPEKHTRSLLDAIHRYTIDLMRDQYGNYVIQFILEQGREHDKAVVITQIRGKLIRLAQHKYASNVCEKALICTDSETRHLLIEEMMNAPTEGENPILIMVKDQYANYVLQRALTVVEGEQRELFFNQVKPLLVGLRTSTTTYNRPLVSIERLMDKYFGKQTMASDRTTTCQAARI